MTKMYKSGSIKRERYLGCLRSGMRRGQAAQACAISRETIRKYALADPAFAQAIDEAEQDACDFVEDALLKKCLEGHVMACIYWLQNRSPERWKDKRNQAQNPPPETTLSIDEMKARLRAVLGVSTGSFLS